MATKNLARTMKTTPRFRSSIPRRAEERITARHANGATATVEYLIEGQRVGARGFDSEGNLESDCGWRAGLRHGTSHRIDIPGRLLSATPYSRGLEHGEDAGLPANRLRSRVLTAWRRGGDSNPRYRF